MKHPVNFAPDNKTLDNIVETVIFNSFPAAQIFFYNANNNCTFRIVYERIFLRKKKYSKYLCVHLRISPEQIKRIQIKIQIRLST